MGLLHWFCGLLWPSAMLVRRSLYSLGALYGLLKGFCSAVGISSAGSIKAGLRSSWRVLWVCSRPRSVRSWKFCNLTLCAVGVAAVVAAAISGSSAAFRRCLMICRGSSVGSSAGRCGRRSWGCRCCCAADVSTVSGRGCVVRSLSLCGYVLQFGGPRF